MRSDTPGRPGRTTDSRLKMPNRNKQRGKYFENKVAETMRSVLNLDKHQCYRSSFSGARTTVEFGDITFSEPEKYPIIVECKYYQEMRLDDFFPKCNSYIEKWVEQVIQEKQRYVDSFNKIPLVVIIAGRPHLQDSYVLIENNLNELHLDLNAINEHFDKYIRCYSTKFNRTYLLISSIDLNTLINKYVC